MRTFHFIAAFYPDGELRLPCAVIEDRKEAEAAALARAEREPGVAVFVMQPVFEAVKEKP